MGDVTTAADVLARAFHYRADRESHRLRGTDSSAEASAKRTLETLGFLEGAAT